MYVYGEKEHQHKVSQEVEIVDVLQEHVPAHADEAAH